MNAIIKTSNNFLETLIAALQAKTKVREALQAMLAAHGGRRTPELMENLRLALCAAYPGCKAEVSVYMGKPNLKFPGKGVGYDAWRDLIAPYLPKIKAATTGKKAKKVDPEKLAIRMAKQLKEKYGKDFVHLLAKLLS